MDEKEREELLRRVRIRRGLATPEEISTALEEGTSQAAEDRLPAAGHNEDLGTLSGG